ncbi:hypothetical protein RM151_08065 [Pantoea agglomerans]|uniref:GTP pyrophosphokinase n=1 Tax=Enterobacter agglomerans TaxID=549 RepID=UPI0028966D34|nr:hypothetical protein [Pantoea agglomerans]WNK59560.1 hypothetical protein RM151_08065 [Pantoea agglomerans]
MSNIINDYDKNKRKYESFAKSLRSLISSLLLAEKINTHSVSFRIKERDSLEGKINSKGTYSCIDDITDIVGLRVITHFADEVDAIAKLIEREFIIDEENTIDKRKALEPDRFGYLSLHYIISISDKRKDLFEYSLYDGLKAEVQIRSILQHTWAEIEHDIGYKSSKDVPRFIKRQFSRLAGLLELADEEFISIRESLSDYTKEVNNNMLADMHNSLTIDKITLREFLKKSSLISNIVDEIKIKVGDVLDVESDYHGAAINSLHCMGVFSIGELEKYFEEYKHEVANRVAWVVNKVPVSFKNNRPYEILALYLAQIIAFSRGGEEGITYLFENTGVLLNGTEVSEFCEGLAEAINSSKN